jgi:hypothetical protein
MREKRAESARFLTAILADLKSVYDRVERVRILIPAHRSALTYGNEMRDLIDARVQLRNVIRALDPNTSGIPNPPLDDLMTAVQAMETYLHDLTDEFQRVYLPIADKQGVYEARKKEALESSGASDVENEAWTDIAGLPGMKGFIGDWRAQGRLDTPHEYVERFETPLDRASLMLRSELGVVAGKKRVPLPGE